ncbi:MAG: hypothetical protein COB54_03085 [Alphaproteobacteria bacterium]|nr:MAG: hypothetical protein COB54_03085 [Alphaproteobacteria bacterium]
MDDLTYGEWGSETGPRGNVREVVGLFNSEDDIQAAVDDLELQGFSNTAISRPARPDKVEHTLHHAVYNARDLEDNSAVPRQAFVDPESRTEGLTVLLLIPGYILIMAALGLAQSYGLDVWQGVGLSLMLGILGLLIGGFFAYVIAQKRIERMRREKKWGGFLLWVRTKSFAQEDTAVTILRHHAGRDVHMHGPAHG